MGAAGVTGRRGGVAAAALGGAGGARTVTRGPQDGRIDDELGD